MNKDFIVKHWYADVYEQFETQTYDVEFLIHTICEQTNGVPQNILEVACGGGRMCVPLAQAGHKVTGFDADEHMLLRCYRRMRGLQNLRCYMADAITTDWGSGFDVVVMAGNLLLNLESDMDNMLAQEILIRKAAAALRRGGHLYLDFDLHCNPASFFSKLKENSYFCGTDDLGTSGRTVSYGGVYNPVTRMCAGADHLELTACNNERFVVSRLWQKHIPTQAQVYRWLADAGFDIERTYKNFSDKPLDDPLDKSTHRATIWARKD